MANDLEARVAAALTKVRNPQIDNDVLSGGMVQDLSVPEDGNVSFTFLLGREDPAGLVREARGAIRKLEGVTDVKIKVMEPGVAGGGQTDAPEGKTPRPPPPPQPVALPDLGHVIAISSGKGGVGKSTVTANIGVALAEQGLSVGIMDADVYGPNIPRMLGLVQQPPVQDHKIIPLEAHGVKVISIGLMIERDAPAIWRGPIIMKIIQQFLGDVDWGTLDYLLVDLPPGTGDAQLSLVQSVQLKGAIIVTTPQEVSVGDALRGVKMFEKVGVPVLGIVENMSYFTAPGGERVEIFSSGGGQKLADEVNVPLLGQIPLQAGMTDLADEGVPIVVGAKDSEAAIALRKVAGEVRGKVGGKSMSLPVISA